MTSICIVPMPLFMRTCVDRAALDRRVLKIDVQLLTWSHEFTSIKLSKALAYYRVVPGISITRKSSEMKYAVMNGAFGLVGGLIEVLGWLGRCRNRRRWPAGAKCTY